MRRRVIVVSVSLEPDLIKLARIEAERAGHKFSFSAWVRSLIREKVECRENTETSH